MNDVLPDLGPNCLQRLRLSVDWKVKEQLGLKEQSGLGPHSFY